MTSKLDPQELERLSKAAEQEDNDVRYYGGPTSTHRPARDAYHAALVQHHRTGQLVHVDDIAVERVADREALECLQYAHESELAMQAKIDALTIALHDAINAPKGVVPASAEAFYDPTLAALRAKESGDV